MAENKMEREVSITRIFDAPREVVFKAWTDPVQLAQWWGPKCFTTPVCELDVRPGGAIHIVMRGPDGTDYPMRGVYMEIVPPERLVFTNNPVDKNGNAQLDGLTTITFTDDGGKTKLTLHTRATGLVPEAAAMLGGMEAGWTQTIDKLTDFVTNTAVR